MSYFRRSDETRPGGPEDAARSTEHDGRSTEDDGRFTGHDGRFTEAEGRFTEDTIRSSADEAPSTGSRWGGLGEKLAKVFTVQEPDEGEAPVIEPGDETVEHDVLAEGENSAPAAAGRFPVGPFGYNRTAVDQYVGELERELEDLRSSRPAPPMSITEEIERLGEQTASILVVAHDEAHETTRRAQEQADRCIADAAANAVAMTAQAKQQLRELDSETDTVWQERQRLIDDVRCTAAALISLADEATERFPEDDKPTIDAPVRFAE